MGVAGTIASGAAKLGKEAVKGIFSGIFGGDKKRTIKKTKVNEVKPEDGEFGTFGAGIIQNNELLSQSIDIQKEQNVILDQILKTLADIKKGSNNKGNNFPGLPNIDLPDLPDKGKKPKPKAETKPKTEPKAEPKVEPKPEPKAEPKVEPKPEPKAEPKTEPKAEPKVEPKVVPEGKPGVTAAAEKVESKITSSKIKEAVTKRVASAMSELAGKALPFGIGAAIGGVFGAIRWWEGDKVGAAAEVAIGASAALPVAGTAVSVAGQIGLMGRDIYNDLYGTEENPYPFDSDDAALITKRMPEIGDYIAKAFEENAKKYELSKKETEEQIEKLKKLDKHVSMNEASNRNNIGGVTEAGKTTASATDADKKAYMADKSKGKMTFPEWFANKEQARQAEYDASTKSLEADNAANAVKEMPKYASGTSYVPETGPAIVGEKGPELVMGKNGNRITDAGAHVEKLNKGDSVLPADKTKNIILDSDWQPHIDQEKHSRYMGGRPDTMSDDERAEYEGFKTVAQNDLSKQMIGDVRNPGSNIDRGSADEFDIRARLQRGERVDPNKPPETMTKRELASRIVEYGMPALISGAYKPEEFAKITREAGQFQWQTDAEDKFHAAKQAKKQPGVVKPLAYAEGTANAETEANKLIDAEKITTAKTIEFIAREILFSAREMTIKTEELKINGEPTTGGAKVLGVTPSTPSAVPSPSAPAGSPTAAPEAAAAGGDKAAAGGLTEVKTKSGKSTKVGAAYASNFQGFINDLENAGYKINSIGGYADRANVNNPSVKSFHAMGAAIDINPGSNPNKSTKTDLPPQTGAIAAAHGLGWGMNWKSVKDPMHFSAAKAEQGSFDIKRGSIAAGEVQGGAAPAGGAPTEKKDATKTDMGQAPSVSTPAVKQATPAPSATPSGPGVSSTVTTAPTYTPGGGRNVPVAAPAAQQQSNGSMTSPGTTPSAEPSTAAIGGKSGSALPSVPPIQGESQQELANRIKSVAPHLKNQQCVTLAKAAVGSNDSVTTWRKGANATDNELPVGTPVATFMDRKGKASERYDAGGTGSPGTLTTHAATVAGYVKDKDGKITGMQVWEQYTGSGGPRLKTYPAGQGFGEKNASNYHAIEQEGKDGQRVALGKSNPYQQYLEKQRAAADEKAIPQVAKPDAVAETQGPPAPPTSGEQVAEVQGPPAPAAVSEESAPKQTAENLAPPEPKPTKQEAAPAPAASSGSSSKPTGGAGISKPGNMGAPSNELIRAYLTVAA
jgi:D-alanyl-D-alanine carboxypeptidase